MQKDAFGDLENAMDDVGVSMLHQDPVNHLFVLHLLDALLHLFCLHRLGIMNNVGHLKTICLLTAKTCPAAPLDSQLSEDSETNGVRSRAQLIWMIARHNHG